MIPGFRTDGIVAMDLALPYSEDPASESTALAVLLGFFNRLRAIPGVDEVAAANAVPLDGGLPDGLFLMIAPQELPKNMQDLADYFQRKDELGTADLLRGVPGIFPRAGDSAHPRTALRRSRWSERAARRAHHRIARAKPVAECRSDRRNNRVRQHGRRPSPLTIVGIVGDTRVWSGATGSSRRCTST